MPFKSKAQQKFMYAAAARGDVSQKTVDKFAAATKSFKALPQRVKKHADHGTEPQKHSDD